MTHGSLFSGIGGFDLAAHWAGIENIFAVEKDPFGQSILKKRFPNTKIYQDIYDFEGKKYNGRIDIISGGFPCQPFSHAGKRAGTNDDRHLWPQMFRVVQEIEPRWVIAENVRGITSISDGDVFEQVCTDLESINYKVQSFIIPAQSLGAPHRRERVWFIANRDSPRELQQKGTNKNERRRFNNETEINVTTNPESLRCGGRGNGNDCDDRERCICENEQNNGYEIRSETISINEFDTTNADNGSGHKEPLQARGQINEVCHTGEWDEHWIEALTRIYGMDDGLPRGVDGLNERYKHRDRKNRIKAMGNAIVPQIAHLIFKTILEAERMNYVGN